MANTNNDAYQKLATTFDHLSHDDKKQKIISMMEYIKDKIDFAWGISDFITQSADVDDAFLHNIYQLIMKTAVESAQAANDTKSQQLLTHIQQILEQHQKIDEQEHQEADELLKNI